MFRVVLRKKAAVIVKEIIMTQEKNACASWYNRKKCPATKEPKPGRVHLVKI